MKYMQSCFVSFLLLHFAARLAMGADCFQPADNLMPRLLSYEGTATAGNEKFTAITGNSDFVIVGGFTNRGALATHSLGDVNLPLLYRTDLATRLYKWGKVLVQVSGEAVRVEALALSPTNLIATFTSAVTIDSEGSKNFFLTVYFANDGGVRTATQKLRPWPASSDMTHKITSANVFFTSDERVIFGMQFFCPSGGTCTYNGGSYDAYMRVGMFPVAPDGSVALTKEFTFINRMSGIYGRSASLAVVDSASPTIYVGGAAGDAAGTDVWAPSISKVDDTGTTQGLYKLVQSPTSTYWPHSAFPMIDHLKIDGTTMFGTTQGSVTTAPGDLVYVFTIDDFNDLGSANLITVSMVKLGLTGSMQVTGVHSALVSSSVHLIYHDPSSSGGVLSYAAVDPTGATSTAVQLYTSMAYIRQSFFIPGGSSSSVTDSASTAHTILQSYSVGAATSLSSDIPDTASKSSGDMIGVLLPSSPTESCLTETYAPDSAASATSLTMAIETNSDTSNEAYMTIIDKVEIMVINNELNVIYDIIWSASASNSWCSLTTTPLPTEYTINAGSIASFCSLTADETQVQSLALTLPTITTSACTNAGPHLWTSWIVAQTSYDESVLQVWLDITDSSSDINVIWYDNYPATSAEFLAYFMLPDGAQAAPIPFIVDTGGSACTLTVPTGHTNQIYILGQASTSQEVGSFDPAGACNQLSNTATISPEPPIGGFFTELASGLGFSWGDPLQTSVSLVGTYTITLTATTCGDAQSTSYTVEVQSCSVLTVTAPVVADISYFVGSGPLTFSLGGFTVAPSSCTYTVDCVVTGDPGTGQFTFDGTTDQSDLKLSVDSSDVSHGLEVDLTTPKTYPVTVTLTGDASGGVPHATTLTFNVLVTDPCLSATITLNSAIIPADTLDYQVGDVQDSLVFDLVGNISDDSTTTSPATLCEDLGYEYVLVDATSAPTYTAANAIFSFDSATMTMGTYTLDASLISAYSLAVGVKFAGTAYTNYAYQSFTKNVIQAPCETASIVLPSSVLDPDTGLFPDQEYYIGDSELRISIGAFTITAIAGKTACDVTYTSAVTSADATQVLPPLVFDSANPADIFYTFVHDQDLTLTKTVAPFYVDFTVTLTATSSDLVTQSYPFTLRVHNPCADPTRSSIVPPVSTNDSYMIGDPSQLVAIPTDFENKSLLICGDLSLSVIADTSIFTIAADSKSLFVYTIDSALDGTSKDVEVIASLADYPTITASAKVTIDFINVDEPISDQVPDFTDDEPEPIFEQISNLAPDFTGDKSVTFDFASEGETSTTELKSFLGSFTDAEDDPFTVEFSSISEDFISVEQTADGEIAVSVSVEGAKNGSYSFDIVVTETDTDGNTTAKSHTISIEVKGVAEEEGAGEGDEDVQVPEIVFDFIPPVIDQQFKPSQPEKARPTMKLSKVDQFGLATVTFSEEFLVPPEEALKLIDSKVLKIWLTPSNPAMTPMLTFTWDLVSFKKNQMQLQLTFVNPKYVSSDSEGPDLLNLEVNQDFDYIFVAKDSGKSVRTPYTEDADTESSDSQPIVYKKISLSLIKQHAADDQAAVAALEQQAAATKSTGSAVGLTNLTVNIVLSGSLALLWGLINSLQLVVHFQLMNVILPSNVAVYYSALYELANFDLIPQDEIYGFLEKNLAQNEEDDEEDDTVDEVTSKLSQQTIDAGYESSDVVENNFMLFLGIGVLIAVLILVLLFWICFHKFQRVQRCTRAIKRAIFWNSFIRTFLETALEAMIAVMIKIYALRFNTFLEGLGSSVAIFQLSLFVIFSFTIPFFLQKNQARLTKPDFMEKYGALTLGMNAHLWHVKIYQSLFIVRRLILSMLIVFAVKSSWAQIMVMTFVNSIQLIYLGLSQPNSTGWVNSLEIWNEYLVLLDLYFMFMYSDGLLLKQNPGYPEYDEQIPDMDAKLDAGTGNIYLLGLLVGSNLLVMIVVQVKSVKHSCKRKCRERRHKKLLEERKLQRLSQYKEGAADGQTLESLVQTESGKLQSRPQVRAKHRRTTNAKQRLDLSKQPLDGIPEAPSYDEQGSADMTHIGIVLNKATRTQRPWSQRPSLYRKSLNAGKGGGLLEHILMTQLSLPAYPCVGSSS